MTKLFLLVTITGLFALGLSACNSDGTINTKVTTAIGNIVVVTCQLDQAVPGIVAVGGAITATIDPALAPEVAAASSVERLVHPAVVAACTGAAAGSKPIAVTVHP